MKSRVARISDILRFERYEVQPVADSLYRQIGVYSWGKGIIENDPLAGSDLSKVKYYSFPGNALILSNIQAWEGAVATSTPRQALEFIASQRFLPYVPIDPDEVCVRYLFHYFLSDHGMTLLRRASPGSVTRNRTLGRKAFEALSVPLPGIKDQRIIAAQLDDAITQLDHFGAVADRRAAPHEMAPVLLNQAFSVLELPLVRLGDLYSVVSDIVQPEDDPQPADRFVGLEHIAKGLGDRLGQAPVEPRKGRKFRFRYGDVLYGYLRPYLNKAWACDGPGLCSVEQYVLRPREDVRPSTLSQVLRCGVTLHAVKEATHSLQLPRIRIALLNEIEVPDVREVSDVSAKELDSLAADLVTLRGLYDRQLERRAALLTAMRNSVFSA